jgi:ribokinase
MDLVTEVPHLPQPGETVLGHRFDRYPGGKGANQAVAAARLGAQVSFYGKIGTDPFREELLHSLAGNGIDIGAVEREEEISSGLASIWVSSNGENTIAYTPGANARVDLPYVERILPRLAKAKILLLQLEIPLTAIACLLERLPNPGPFVILDPAPAQDLSSLPLSRIDLITPNQGELKALTGKDTIEEGGHCLLEQGVREVLCKAGGEGVYLVTARDFLRFPALPVDPIDTTGAGDAFNGALGWALIDRSLPDAIRWANAAGALTTTKRGAQPSLPTLGEVERFLRDTERKG